MEVVEKVDVVSQREIRRWNRRREKLLSPKRTRIKRKQKIALWDWRVNHKKPSERPSFIKHAAKMQKYAKKGQLLNGNFYCKAGILIDQKRIYRYEAMCHFIVRTTLPGLGLWEAALSYEDLVNRCRLEVFLALLDGFDPKSVMNGRTRTKEEETKEIEKLEKTIVYGRIKSYLRRTTWKNHPDQLGGSTWCLDKILNRDDCCSEEFRYGIFSQNETDPFFTVDFVREQKESLLDILEMQGPAAAKQGFLRMDKKTRDLVQDSLFAHTDTAWPVVEDAEGWGQCILA